MDYSTFLDRMKRTGLGYRNLSRLTQLDVSTIARYIRNKNRLPGEAIFAIADDLQLTPEEVALELLGIEPRKTRPSLTDDELIDEIARRVKA